MKITIDQENGRTEIIVHEPGTKGFLELAELLEEKFNISFTSKVQDFDSAYWDFEFNGSELVLFHNVYEGTLIFPKAIKTTSQADNQRVVELGNQLLEMPA